MRISELKKFVDEAYKKGDASVEIYLQVEDNENAIELEISNISQFNVIPDLIFDLKTKNKEEILKVKLDKEQANYREKYYTLKNKTEKMTEEIQKIVNSYSIL
jgi:hypothetical protein